MAVDHYMNEREELSGVRKFLEVSVSCCWCRSGYHQVVEFSSIKISDHSSSDQQYCAIRWRYLATDGFAIQGSIWKRTV
jgi:hypothetical protein